MITTTLGALAVAEDALVRLRSRPLAPVVAYRVSVLLAQVRDRLVHYHTIHADLVKELGMQRPATNGERQRFGETVFEVAPSNLETFRVRVRDLHAERITLDVDPIDITTLGLDPITAGDMDVLAPLLTIEGLSHG